MRKLVFILITLSTVICQGQQWNQVVDLAVSGYPGRVGKVDTILFVSGGIDSVNGIETSSLISFNGYSWQGYLPGFNGAFANVVEYNNLIYFGGSISSAGGDTFKDMLVTWDGANWGGFGSTSSSIKDIVTYGGKLYAVGTFGDVFGATGIINIMSHDGLGFYPVGGPFAGFPLTINCLAVYDSLLIVGGGFHTADGIPANNLAAWDGSEWKPYAGGTNNTVLVMYVDTVNEYLYASGIFSYAGGSTPVNYFAKWDGQNWFNLDVGKDCNVNKMQLYQNQLYAGGCFDTIDNKPIARIGRFNGVDWDSLGVAYSNNGAVTDLEVYREELYVAGSFSSMGDTLAPGLMKWYYPLDSACKEMYAGIGVHPDTIYTGQLPYTFRSGCYGNSSLRWEFSDGYTNGRGHCAYNFNNTPGTYDIMLTAQCGTEADTVYSQVVIVSNAAVEEKSPFDLKVYPNPSDGKISVVSEQLVGKEVQVSIYDLQGKQVYQRQLKFSSDTLQLTLDLPKGSYQLSLLHENQKLTKTIQIQ